MAGASRACSVTGISSIMLSYEPVVHGMRSTGSSQACMFLQLELVQTGQVVMRHQKCKAMPWCVVLCSAVRAQACCTWWPLS